MAVVLIILSFLALVASIYTTTRRLSSAIITGILVMSFLVLVSSEILSYINSFNYKGLFSSWIFISAISLLIAIKRKAYLHFKEFITYIGSTFQSKKSMMWYLCAIFLLLIVQGIIYPPNNWDSMTYHMARIPHWLSNQNIYPYPTNIYRQIYQPPFAEFWIAHVCVLSQNDFFANAVQLFFLAGIIIVSIETATELAFTKKAKTLVIIFILTTPEILLEATSTQNDIVVTFFILSVALYCIKCYKALTLNNILFLAISTGLACLTKGTAYVYMLPLFMIWGVLILIRNYKEKSLPRLTRVALIPAIALIVNAGHFYRNYQLSGSLMGNDENYFNEKQSPSIASLNIVKNAALHLGIPPLYDGVNNIISKLHILLDEKIDDPATNWNGSSFKLEKWNLHEDNASNFLQVLLIALTLLSVTAVWNSVKSKNILSLLMVIPIIEFVFFSILLKWQPWHTRLHIPIFCMFGLTTAYIADKILDYKKRNVIRLVITSLFILMIVSSLLVILANPSRPLIAFTKLTTARLAFSRDQKYFGLRRDSENEYFKLIAFVEKHSKETGLIIGGDSWEYPLYHNIFSRQGKMTAMPHIRVFNFSKNTVLNIKLDSSKIRYIIIEEKKDTLHFDNAVFYRIKQLPTFTILQRP